ncbi:MAG: hypothetical protein HQK84_02750, partial [Nitrospinae bacterium]|nr:hypothetical protein [Nitrospinota bacterium]
MNVTKHCEQDKAYIVATGNFETEDDSHEFIKALCNSEEVDIEITFLDIWLLPPDVIEILADFPILFPEKKVKLFTLNRQLYSYLYNLGINSRFVSHKVLYRKQETNVESLAIGGSAESLERIFTIIERLPLSEISVFIIQHVREESKTLLDELLRKRTDYPVSVAQDKEIVKKKQIYIAPSSSHMKVIDGVIFLSKEPPVNYARPSIDVLFSSLAKEYGNRLIVMVLSGYGSDAVQSLDLLKKSGSTVIIEDPNDCPNANVLPTHAIESGNFHHIMDIKEAGRYLYHLFSNNEIEDKDVKIFLEDVFEQYGYDFRSYNLDSLKRRIQNFIRMEHFDSFGEMAIDIMEEADCFEKFLIALSVSVTAFFRNPNIYRCLRENILPRFSESQHIRVWSAGCATGEEPYSIAIVLEESGLLEKTDIYATDINPNLLNQAKNGLFSMKKQDEDSLAYKESN